MNTSRVLSHLVIGSAFSMVLVLCACGNDSKKTADNQAADTLSTTAPAATKDSAATDTGKVKFDIAKIPLTTKALGEFPYLKVPAEYKYNDISKSDLAMVHFAVDGQLMAVEGKKFSSNIYKLSETGTPFNQLIVQRAYEQAIKDLGGVQVSTKLLPGEIERVGKKLLEDEGDHAYTIIGANDYTLSHVNTYIIRTATANVWIELSFYENGGYIYIIEQAVK